MDIVRLGTFMIKRYVFKMFLYHMNYVDLFQKSQGNCMGSMIDATPPPLSLPLTKRQLKLNGSAVIYQHFEYGH